MDEKIVQAANILNDKGVVIIPTDTVYGLAAGYENKESIRKIYNIKNRSLDKPIAILVPAISSVWDFVEKNIEIAEILRNNWPGAVTFILRAKDGSDIGLRMPDSDPILELMTLTGPLAATSANISDTKAPGTLEEIPQSIKDECDMVLKLDFSLSGIPSKVIDLTDENKTVIRK